MTGPSASAAARAAGSSVQHPRRDRRQARLHRPPLPGGDPPGHARRGRGAQPRHRRDLLPGRIRALAVQPGQEVFPGQLRRRDPGQQLPRPEAAITLLDRANRRIQGLDHAEPVTQLADRGQPRARSQRRIRRADPHLRRFAEAAASPLGPDLGRFLAGAEALGYSVRARTGMASQIAIRMLIQAGRALAELTDADFAEFGNSITEREARLGRALKHYHGALYASRAVIYHLGAPAEPVPKRCTLGRWSWERHLEGVSPQVRRPMTAYLERLQATLARSTVQGAASELAHFGRFLARHDPGLSSLALLDRQRHIEPYLNEVAAAVNHRTGQPIAASTAKERIQTVGSFLDAIAEWGWPEAPARRLVFPRDAPRLPHPLPRYLPPDAERALLAALEDSPNRLRADALLLLRATGMRIGELTDLELDCVHEVPGQGAWLKVPLGKLLTERMVPIDEETLEIIDRIVAHRSPGRPLRHPRTGQLADFLLTHQGRRVSADSLREELQRAAAEAGLDGVVPHQLRHTYATALVNAGCSLQALMALLGHVSAEMSLRYGRLFDATVRDEYTRALALAKAQLGPVLPGDRTQLPSPASPAGTGGTRR